VWTLTCVWYFAFVIYRGMTCRRFVGILSAYGVWCVVCGNWMVVGGFLGDEFPLFWLLQLFRLWWSCVCLALCGGGCYIYIFCFLVGMGTCLVICPRIAVVDVWFSINIVYE
jgi:hypothetical protein